MCAKGFFMFRNGRVNLPRHRKQEAVHQKTLITQFLSLAWGVGGWPTYLEDILFCLCKAFPITNAHTLHASQTLRSKQGLWTEEVILTKIKEQHKEIFGSSKMPTYWESEWQRSLVDAWVHLAETQNGLCHFKLVISFISVSAQSKSLVSQTFFPYLSNTNDCLHLLFYLSPRSLHKVGLWAYTV